MTVDPHSLSIGAGSPKRSVQKGQAGLCRHGPGLRAERLVARVFGVRMTDLRRASRGTAQVALARQVAMYLSKQMTSRSLPEIGRKFGGRDHTTVIHAVRKVDDLRRQDSGLEEDLHRLTRLLRA